jgi:hypothetical protein
MSSPPVPQEQLMQRVLPLLKCDGKLYRKHQAVMARAAVVGELIVSVTSSGEETRNTASEGDYVVKNLTRAEELYIVRGPAFRERYELESSLDEWSRYRPLGRVIALEVGDALVFELGVANKFWIQAPWNEPQVTEVGDFLVCPPNATEIYRIARTEFEETYTLDF